MEEQRCIGIVRISDYAPQTVQNQFIPAKNTIKREEERRMDPTTDSTASGHLRSLLIEKRSPRSPAKGRNITAIRCFTKNIVTF